MKFVPVAVEGAHLNQGRSGLLAFLDDDAAAASDWNELLTRACAEPDVLGAGGRVLRFSLDALNG